ncbi:MAG: hypothetical protein SFX74_05795 [Fimbriimonadaceae bacterium]|nr:hypothetical protein [Fimbriimonadaceae bacterium]
MNRIETVFATLGFSFGLAVATFVGEYASVRQGTEEPLGAVLLAALHAFAALVLSLGLAGSRWDFALSEQWIGHLLLAIAMIGALAVSRILWFTPESGIEQRLSLPGVTEPVGRIDAFGFAAAWLYLTLRTRFRRGRRVAPEGP